MVNFHVYNRTHLIDTIFPIFDDNKLLTSKRWNYLRFKKCVYLSVYGDESLTEIETEELIDSLIKETLSEFYVSDAWNKLLSYYSSRPHGVRGSKRKEDLKLFSKISKELECKVLHNNQKGCDKVRLIMSRSWLAGFIEGDGSFYLVTKDSTTGRLVHGFGLTQTLDCVIMHSIKILLEIKGNIKWKSVGHYSLNTTGAKTVKHIIEFFLTDDSTSFFKGIKGIDFKLWRDSFNNHKGDYEELTKVRQKMRVYKNITRWDS